jgi:hypothetical protein
LALVRAAFWYFVIALIIVVAVATAAQPTH